MLIIIYKIKQEISLHRDKGQRFNDIVQYVIVELHIK